MVLKIRRECKAADRVWAVIHSRFSDKFSKTERVISVFALNFTSLAKSGMSASNSTPTFIFSFRLLSAFRLWVRRWKCSGLRFADTAFLWPLTYHSADGLLLRRQRCCVWSKGNVLPITFTIQLINHRSVVVKVVFFVRVEFVARTADVCC